MLEKSNLCSLSAAHSEMFGVLPEYPVRALLLLKALAKAQRALVNGLEACVRWMLFINAKISIETIILKIIHHCVKFCIKLHKKLFTTK